MILKVVRLAFEKAKKETPNKSKNGLSTHISNRIQEDHPERVISYKTLTRYYEKYIDGKTGVIDEPQPEIIEFLCEYLGYSGYADFVKKTRTKQIFRLLIGLAVIFSITLIFLFNNNWSIKSLNNERMNCITWSEDHYVLIVCPKNHDPSIIPFDEKLLTEFKKIEVDTNYHFFDDNSKARVWYDKTGGNIEFFNMSGNHPTNGKKLKPITQTIIRKYVFGEE